MTLQLTLASRGSLLCGPHFSAPSVARKARIGDIFFSRLAYYCLLLIFLFPQLISNRRAGPPQPHHNPVPGHCEPGSGPPLFLSRTSFTSYIAVLVSHPDIRLVVPAYCFFPIPWLFFCRLPPLILPAGNSCGELGCALCRILFAGTVSPSLLEFRCFALLFSAQAPLLVWLFSWSAHCPRQVRVGIALGYLTFTFSPSFFLICPFLFTPVVLRRFRSGSLPSWCSRRGRRRSSV